MNKKLTTGITLKPDSNRHSFCSKLAKQLADGTLPDSLFEIQKNHSGDTYKAKILLIITQYTRIKRPLDIIADRLIKLNGTHLKRDLQLIKDLHSNGLEYIEEMKRAGVPMGLLRIGTQAKANGYAVKIIDGAYEGWNIDKYAFTTHDGSEMWTYGISNETMIQAIREYKPDIIGISCDYTHQW